MSEISIAIADDNLQTLSLLNDILEGEEDFHVVGKADNGEDAYNMIVKTSLMLSYWMSLCREWTELR